MLSAVLFSTLTSFDLLLFFKLDLMKEVRDLKKYHFHYTPWYDLPWPHLVARLILSLSLTVARPPEEMVASLVATL